MPELTKLDQFILKFLPASTERIICPSNHILHLHKAVNYVFSTNLNTEISLRDLTRSFEVLEYPCNIRLSEILKPDWLLTLTSTAHYFVDLKAAKKLENYGYLSVNDIVPNERVEFEQFITEVAQFLY